jgi:hypothetical protein
MACRSVFFLNNLDAVKLKEREDVNQVMPVPVFNVMDSFTVLGLDDFNLDPSF